MKLGFAAMLVLAATALSVVATPIQRSIAQNNSPTNIPSNIRDLQRVNSVTISGEVVQVRGDEFILRDTTGEMLVEAESLAIRQANLKAGDRVTVVGNYDDDNHLEALSLTSGNGSVIYVFDD